MIKGAVIGDPIQHSLSPHLQFLLAKQVNQSIIFEKIQTTPKDFVATIQRLQNNNYVGCNITAPVKLLAFQIATHSTARAQQAGAANCLKFSNKEILADNCDGWALVQDLLQANFIFKNKRILILGAGGATQGILPALLATEPNLIAIQNRTLAKAQALVQQFAQPNLTSFDATMKSFDLIINTIPASANHSFDYLPLKSLAWHAWCYDLNYQMHHTPFLQWASLNGCSELRDGLGMLFYVNVFTFEWYTNLKVELNKLKNWRENLFKK